VFERQGEEKLHAGVEVQGDVAHADYLGGDVAGAVHAQQLAIVGAEYQLEQPGVSGDGAAWSGGQVAAAHHVGDAGRANLLLETINTRRPNAAASSAATSPAGPAPITTQVVAVVHG
jgi:hypothetical protein